MNVAGPGIGSPGRAKALANHAKALASGNVHRQKAAIQKLDKMNVTPIEKMYVASKVHEHQQKYVAPRYLKGPKKGQLYHDPHNPSEVLPGNPNTKPGKQELMPILGGNPDHIVRQQRQLGKIRQGLIEQNKQYDAMLNPVSHENLAAAAEDLTGYHEIANISHHPIAGPLAIAGLIPGLGTFGHVTDALRGVSDAEKAARVEEAARAADEASGLRKVVAKRRLTRLARRGSPEDAQASLEQERQNAIAKATKAARKNPSFVEHLPGESRPETGGAVGLKVREAMRNVKKVYKKQQELQSVERVKRTARLAEGQKGAKSFEDLAGAQKALAGEMPKAPFKDFEPLKPIVEDIKQHVDGLNMLPHDKNRLVNAIKAGINGKVPAPAERKLIESVFGKEVRQLSPEAIKERGIEGTFSDVANLPRAIESSFDLSGALRQNLGALLYDPLSVIKGYHETLHAAVSQKEFERIMAKDIHGDPYYHMAKADGVQVTEMGEHLNQREEAFASNLAEHLHELPLIRSTPGLKQVAHGVSAGIKASDRNYIILLNRTRMRIYHSMVEQAASNGWRMDGPAGEKLRKEIADTVNTLTGRGTLGKRLAAHRATFQAVFFSPGLMKSRINLLNPVWYMRASPFVRQQRLKLAMRLYGTLSLVLATAKAAGAQVVTDPTNADFGKIRIGNTRIDPAGGLTQYMRLIGQLEEGKITSSVTGKVEPLSNGPFKTSEGNVIQSFLRNKMAPVPGLAYDKLFGAGFGQKLTPSSVAGQMFVPLMLQDMYAISLQGPPWNAHINHQPGAGPGMAGELFLPDLLGVGVQNYGGQKKKGSGASSYGSSSGYVGSGGYGGSSGYDSGGYGP